MWLLCASLTACFESLKDVTGKQSLKTLDAHTVLLALAGICSVVLFAVMLLTSGVPAVQPGFWLALPIGGSLNILAYTLYVRAIQTADLSLTVPLVSLTTLFLLLTSPLIVGEMPTPADGVGVVLLVVGSYVLNLRRPYQRPWAPLLALIKNSGSRSMLGVAFIWSITSNFDKVGTLNSSPLCWGGSLFGVVAVGMVPFVARRGAGTWAEIRPQLPMLGLTGLFNAAGVGFQFLALTLVPVAQVIAVKRLSTLLTVLFGHFLFKEAGLRERLLGAVIMVGGVTVMSLF